MSTVLRPAVERDWESTIIDAARLGGWLVHAERAAQSRQGWRTPIRGHAGWPDLFLVRDARIIVAELKRRPNKITAAQQTWLDALVAAGVDARVVWVPDDVQALCGELVGR